MTPEEVHKVQFRRGSIFARGYDPETVDLFLDRIVETLHGNVKITRQEVTDTTLAKPPFGARGYLKDDVDSFLRRVADEWPTG